MNAQPLVSVVMCFLDAERFIEEAIESVFLQSYEDWELVLVDDGSRDRSTEIARRYARNRPERVQYVEHSGHRNLGMSASRNAGITAARGAYIGFLDSDDVLLPHALQTLAAALDAAPEAAVAYGRTQMWFSWPGNPEGRTPAWDWDSRLPAAAGAVLPPGALLPALVREDDGLPSVCSALARRETLERVGGWDAAFVDLYEDFVVWAKLFAEHAVVVVDHTLSRYRQHEGSSSDRAERSGEYSPVDLNVARYRYLSWMERWLTRRRFRGTETWRALDAALQPYRHPTAPVAVEAVEPLGGPAVQAHLDHPASRSLTRSHRVPIGGWVAANGTGAVAVEVTANGQRLHRAAVDVHRPDVAATLGLVSDGERHGFATTIALAGTTPQEIAVTAVLEDQRRLPVARLHLRRVIRLEDHLLGATPVSVVIVCRTEAGGLEGVIQRALAQDHQPLEVIVVDDGSSSALEQIALAYPGVRYVRRHGEGVAAARRAGLERSRGEAIMFLGPHDELLPTAVSAALARLEERPECGFVAGATADRPLDHATLLHDGAPGGPALYRRFAIAAAGIPDCPTGLDDDALQLSVARTLPGIAVADPMLAVPRTRLRVAPDAHRILLGEERRHVKDRRGRQGLAAAEGRLTVGDARPARPPRRRRRTTSTGQGRALILLYHRIGELPADPWALSVARTRFAEQLEVLRSESTVLSLQDVVARIGRGGLPERTVAVTFDDGYRDNLTEALPELEAAALPATFFITADGRGAAREMWWDELERVLLSPGTLPEALELRIAGSTFTRDLGESAAYGTDEARRNAGWRVGQPPPTPRHAIYAALWAALLPLSASTREPILDELLAWAVHPRGIRPSHRLLGPQEIRTLADNALAEVGGHTVSHPRLSAQRPDDQRGEIAEGRAALQELVGRPVRHFAYPFGGLRDYTGATARIVQDAGWSSACATWTGLAHAASDPFQLPRIQVDDVGGEEFAAQLAGWFAR
jgi:glycosyltransferase involved in cell wall biosynthesis/peptidoglycan/xylan/chitin deacetylase (PgdA/CDA1 family)